MKVKEIPAPKTYYTPWQAAEILQVKEYTVTDYLRKRIIIGEKVGKRWRIPKCSLNAFINGGEE